MTYDRKTMINVLEFVAGLSEGHGDEPQFKTGDEEKCWYLALESGFIRLNKLSPQGQTALIRLKAEQDEADRQAEAHEWERDRHKRERLKLRIDFAAITLAALSFVVSIASLYISGAVLFSSRPEPIKPAAEIQPMEQQPTAKSSHLSDMGN